MHGARLVELPAGHPPSSVIPIVPLPVLVVVVNAEGVTKGALTGGAAQRRHSYRSRPTRQLAGGQLSALLLIGVASIRVGTTRGLK